MIDDDHDDDMDIDGGAPLQPGPATKEEQWASIVEAITYDTIKDTMIAQLESLVSFSDLLDDSRDLKYVEKYAEKVLKRMHDTNQHPCPLDKPYFCQCKPESLDCLELNITVANYWAALWSAKFRTLCLSDVPGL